jgi:hypothetical protein
MEGLQVRPSTHLRVHKREYDETMAVTVGRRPGRVHLGKPATERIWVRRLAS